MGMLIVAQQPLWYINGLPCFIMGIAYQRYEDRILAYLSLNKISTIASLTLLFLLFFQWRYVSENVSVLSAYRYTYMAIYLNNILFVALIIAIMTSFVKTTEIAAGGYNWLFYEVYLLQRAMMIVCTSFQLCFGWIWVLTFLTLLPLSLLVHKLNELLFGLANTKK